MDIENELKQIAKIYIDQGYQVTIQPGPQDLPAFAKDFKVEILAKRGADALVAVRKNCEAAARDAHGSVR